MSDTVIFLFLNYPEFVKKMFDFFILLFKFLKVKGNKFLECSRSANIIIPIIHLSQLFSYSLYILLYFRLKSSFEVAPGSMVPRNEIYAEYVSFCGKAGRKGVVNANLFASIVK